MYHLANQKTQVLRAMELTGQQVDRQYYQAWFARAQQGPGGRLVGGSWAQQAPPGQGAGDGEGAAGSAEGNVGVERLKWWLGLPNRYYQLRDEAEARE